MDLRQLEYFITIAEEKNITRAARKLYISQPALTLYLSNLERELGTKLFTRIHNKLELTYPGSIYMESAQRILAENRTALNAISEYTNNRVGELRIATTPGRASVAMSSVYPAFQRSYPNILFNLTETTAADCIKQLISGKTDLIFLAFTDTVFTKKEMEQCDSIALFQDEPILVTWRDNPAGRNAKRTIGFPFPVIHLFDFADERFILLPKGSHTHHVTNSLFEREQISPNILLYLQSFSTIYSLLESCHASTISTLVHYHPNDNLDYYSLRDVPSWNLSAIYRKDFHMTQYHKYCIELFRNDFNRIKKQISLW